MDTDVHAFYGFSVSSGGLFKEKRTAVCRHHNEIDTEEPNKFCSICGKPLWGVRFEPIDNLIGDDLSWIKDMDGAQWPVIKTKMFKRWHADTGEKKPSDTSWFIADRAFHTQTGLGRSSDLVSRRDTSDKLAPEDIRARMRRTFEPMGLWNGMSFGLYAVRAEAEHYDYRD